MNYLKDFFGNEVLMCALLSWVVAQGIKVLLTLIMDKRLDWRRCFGMGGMPSSHSALTFSLMLMTGLKTGFGSVEFALAFSLTAIVIYDAMGVRAETGKQGA
ncbi:MAG: divergent PAP2 family protein, partial [Clostridia bacterium]|nr:divergent PAP2 family protein [Clostridia bacterium]